MTHGVDTASRAAVASVQPGVAPHCIPEEGCVTCGDVAEEMWVVRIDDERELALCEHASGERQTVEIALVQPVSPADTLLVHAGTAISNLGPGSDRNTPGREAEEVVR
jgi:hydrogenase maturation factor